MPARKKPQSKPNSTLPKILILAGIVILIATIYLTKNQPDQNQVAVSELPQTQLERFQKEGKPILAFFHSTDCHSCIVMMDAVARVYPEFKNSIGLVDVDVYDERNNNLMRQAGIVSIPTLIFIDRKGKGKVSIGVIEDNQLRSQLTALKETP